MLLSFVASSLKDPTPTVEVTTERGHTSTVIKYPAPDPKDRADEEYLSEDDDSE